MNCKIRRMTLHDYAAVHRLWLQTEGMSLTEDDNREGIALYLRRNRGLCFIATSENQLIGTVLCGHDGRRGILRHLAVQKEFRKQGIALRLVQKSLTALAVQGIQKCNLYVMDYNVTGLRFWKHIGFHLIADDYRTLQIGTGAFVADKTG
jgi:N-acetylglutamate synthase